MPVSKKHLQTKESHGETSQDIKETKQMRSTHFLESVEGEKGGHNEKKENKGRTLTT
jgi:hypothetical protein